MDSLKNHVALVTGSSSGIGKAIALALAGHGAELFLAARGKEALGETAKEAQKVGARAHTCSLDLTKDEDIRALGRPHLQARALATARRRRGNGDARAAPAAHRGGYRHQYPPDAEILLALRAWDDRAARRVDVS